MNNIKTLFTIKDLENISGVKAHTIRIWEKRYNLLTPGRTQTNIRYYSLDNLRRLLSIVLLNKNQYKISRIAQMSEDQINILARGMSTDFAVNEKAINEFKLAMFNFDRTMFNTTYSELLTQKTFKELVKDVFIPFLNHIGLLWQTDTLSPGHEHFISNLIIQKIQINIEKIQYSIVDEGKKYVLFLPDGEIHEIGLLYLNYELLSRGFSTVYLGQSLPIKDLHYFLEEEEVVFVSTNTIRPYIDDLDTYFAEIKSLLKNTNHQFISIGSRTLDFQKMYSQENIKFHSCFENFLQDI